MTNYIKCVFLYLILTTTYMIGLAFLVTGIFIFGFDIQFTESALTIGVHEGNELSVLISCAIGFLIILCVGPQINPD